MSRYHYSSYKTILLSIFTSMFISTSLFAHNERPADFPNYPGEVPKFRETGPALVVCRPDSEQRIKENLKGKMRKDNLALLAQCTYDSIQDAVDAAQNGTRILLLPGVYYESASAQVPYPDPNCLNPNLWTIGNYGYGYAPKYEYQLCSPRSQNMIAVLGDTDGDRQCDSKCNIQITGTARPEDVLIQGERKKLNIIRLDRADGIYLGNFTIQHSHFNNIYVLETNGFHFNNIISRYSNEYGFLSFVSDNGLYQNIEAYGNGDAGIYPGSGPQSPPGVCDRRIEVRNVNSHHNAVGFSATAGDNIWVHHSKFHNNAVGLATESFSPGHPGMPQNCSLFEHNEIYSNNFNPYSPDYVDDFLPENNYLECKKHYEDRDPLAVCPVFIAPVGVGLTISGGNDNIVRKNFVYDNWRAGVTLFTIPIEIREGIPFPPFSFDNSFNNAIYKNHMGKRPDGTRDPNGVDFIWDGGGLGNYWVDNKGSWGTKASITSIPSILPSVPSTAFTVPDFTALIEAGNCWQWDVVSNPEPAGCTWYITLPEPQ